MRLSGVNFERKEGKEIRILRNTLFYPFIFIHYFYPYPLHRPYNRLYNQYNQLHGIIIFLPILRCVCFQITIHGIIIFFIFSFVLLVPHPHQWENWPTQQQRRHCRVKKAGFSSKSERDRVILVKWRTKLHSLTISSHLTPESGMFQCGAHTIFF